MHGKMMPDGTSLIRTGAVVESQKEILALRLCAFAPLR
jgi:hypothetical protein